MECTRWRLRQLKLFEGARETIKEHFGASNNSEIIFTSGATDSINLVAGSWGRSNLSASSTVLLTRLEHHSNIVPWQILASEIGFKIEVVEIFPDGTLDIQDYKAKLSLSPSLVCFSHVSNTLGTINDAKLLTSLAHEAGALVLVDGAQAAPHMNIDFQDINCDFYAASGHKMYGPYWNRISLWKARYSGIDATLARWRRDDFFCQF